MTTTVISVISSTNNGHGRGLTVYTSWAAWEADAPANLVSVDQIWRGEGYNDGVFSSASNILTMSGSVSSATCYKEATAAAGESFADNANVQTNALRYNTANGLSFTESGAYVNAVSLDEAHCRISRIQIKGTGNGSCIGSSQVTARVERCIAEAVKGVISGPVVAVNSLFLNTLAGSIPVHYQAGPAYYYNCTIVALGGSSYVTRSLNYAVSYSTNCAFFGCTTGIYQTPGGGGTANYTTCYTSIASPPAGCTQVAFDTSTGSGFQNITSGTHDFRLKSTSALIGVGTTDATNAPVDIAGTARPSGTGYDVGVWEYVAAGGSASIAASQAIAAFTQSAAAAIMAAASSGQTISAFVQSATAQGVAAVSAAQTLPSFAVNQAAKAIAKASQSSQLVAFTQVASASQLVPVFSPSPFTASVPAAENRAYLPVAANRASVAAAANQAVA